MCGIAGALVRSGAAPPRPPRAAVEAAVTRLQHRGPDDRGVVDLPGAAGAIGNTRLAIQDTSRAGHQPMGDEAGNWVVLNGELYNHLEVREALGGAEGWRSRSDTETLLRAYAAWGRGCLDRLRGMFAFVLWDARAGELWCARDRLGIKPLYFVALPWGFAFASEVRALVAAGLVQPRLDRIGLASYARFGAVSDPRTLLEGVRSLPAGDWLRVVDGRVVEQQAYWRPRLPLAGVRPQETPATVEAHLRRAVREHLAGDVPVASFLSGGLDSALVTTLAARHAAEPIRAFTFGFAEAGFDESVAAARIAARCGAVHTRVVLDAAEVAREVPRALDAMDLPTADGVNTFVIAGAAARAGVKVALSGLGGDELFGGYPSFRLVPGAARWSPLLGRLPRRALALAGGGGGRGARAAALMRPGASLAERYEQVRALWSDAELLDLGLEPSVPSASWAADEAEPAGAVSLLELSGYMRNTLLRDADVMSMARSIELRVPLLDHELVQACLDARVAGPARGRPKAALVELSRGLLPPDALARPKRGFALPMDAWMRGPLRSLVAEGVTLLTARGVLAGAPGDLLRRFERGRLPWARLWQFVVLGHWLAQIECSGGRA
ncbi:MAG: asparagine synthase (glutamine-hydrolyzing) [Planctomycetes bacterium]|nr:asparagine synthase (glutamine-hydrolyzing) [Planctomycetota bacterium]